MKRTPPCLLSDRYVSLPRRRKCLVQGLSVVVATAFLNGYFLGQQSGQAASETVPASEGPEDYDNWLSQTPMSPVFFQRVPYQPQYATSSSAFGSPAYPIVQTTPVNWLTAPATPMRFHPNTPRAPLGVSAVQSYPGSAAPLPQALRRAITYPPQTYFPRQSSVSVASPLWPQPGASSGSLPAHSNGPPWSSPPVQTLHSYRPQLSAPHGPSVSSSTPPVNSPQLPAIALAESAAVDQAVSAADVSSQIRPSSGSAISRGGGYRTISYTPDRTHVVTLDSNTTPETDEWDPFIRFEPSGRVSLQNPQEASAVDIRIFAGDQEYPVANIVLDGLQTQTLNLAQYVGREIRIEMRYWSYATF